MIISYEKVNGGKEHRKWYTWSWARKGRSVSPPERRNFSLEAKNYKEKNVSQKKCWRNFFLLIKRIFPKCLFSRAKFFWGCWWRSCRKKVYLKFKIRKKDSRRGPTKTTNTLIMHNLTWVLALYFSFGHHQLSRLLTIILHWIFHPSCSYYIVSRYSNLSPSSRHHEKSRILCCYRKV